MTKISEEWSDSDGCYTAIYAIAIEQCAMHIDDWIKTLVGYSISACTLIHTP